MIDQIEKKNPALTQLSATRQPNEQPEQLEKRSEQAGQIERAKREWEVTVDALPQLICLLDQHGHIIRANRTVERWQLGQVKEVKEQEVHSFLHPVCADPACHLSTFLNQAWVKLVQGQPVECEIEDEILERYLHLQLRPLSSSATGENLEATTFAVLVLDDVTEQKQGETALHQYTLELKARNEELDAFAHTVAHNLKAPLVPIIGNAELLRTRYNTMPVERREKDLETIIHNGHKMSKIIDELLLLAGVRKTDVVMKPIDMTAIVTDVQRRLAYMIEEYQAELILPTTWPYALGYGPWIEEVWANYISNAIKYGGQPPRLELGAMVSEEEKGTVRFWVRDNGQGLTPDEQARLFTPFTQLNKGGAGGHGLGLSIVRRIVEKLGGEVSVASESTPGRGSVFSFTLPRR